MKKITLLFIFLLGCISATFSQTMVSGAVIDSSAGETLPYATIVVKGTNIGTTTDINGEYRLPLNNGSYTLVASFMGFDNLEQEVTINNGKAIELDFNLVAQAILGEEVVVTAMLRGQKAAISSQLNADGIVNAVSEEQIQELPDANAGDALGRLPGVSLKRSGGEAENIVLRGLNEKYSAVQMNGINVPASGESSRGVDMSMFSVNSLAGIEVTKALTSDMNGDAIAGVVNMVTKRAPSKPKLQVNVGGGYNMLENSAEQYNAAFRYSRRLFDEVLGVQVGINSEQRIRSRESWSDKWDIRDGGDYQIQNRENAYTDEIRTRYGGNLLLDINTKDGGVIRFNNFYNNTGRDVAKYRRNYPLTGHVEYGISEYQQTNHSLSNALTGENYLGKLKVNWGLSHAFTVGERDFDHELEFDEGAASESGMRNPTTEEWDNGIAYTPGDRLYPLAYNNFRTSYLDQGFFNVNKNQDRDLMAYLDLERTFAFTDKVNMTVKAGAKYRHKIRDNEVKQYKASYYNQLPMEHEMLEDGSIVPLDLSDTSFSDLELINSRISMLNFLNDPDNPAYRYILDGNPINPLLDRALAREWYETRQNAVNSSGDTHEYRLTYDGTNKNYDLQERIAAAYAMSTLNIGEKMKLIAGVRIEQDNNDYTAKFAPNVSGRNTYDPSLVSDTTSTYKATYVLPNFHVKYKPVAWFDLRLAATKTLARPNFTMRLPTQVIDRQKDKISQGNTALRSTEAWNYDVIASFYESKYGLFTVGAFYKQLDNVFYNLGGVNIVNEEMAESYNLPVSDDYGYDSYIGYTISSPINTMNTEVKGIEFDLQANLKFLPGFLGNFILRGNYSFIESVTYVPRFVMEEDNSVFPPKRTPKFYETKQSLEGQPSSFGNIVLGYSEGGFSARFSFFHQGEFLTSMSSDIDADYSELAYNKLDFSVKQKVEKWKTEFILNINNIGDLNQQGTYYNNMGFDQYNPNGLVRGYNTYGTTIDFGVRINL